MDHGDGTDELSGVLTDQRRRYLLYSLFLYSTPQRLPRIADQLTVWETGAPAEERRDERLRIYMSLYHDHVPELVDADIVAYRQQADTVDWDTELTPATLSSPLKEQLCAEIEDLLAAEAGTFDGVRRTDRAGDGETATEIRGRD